MLAKDFGNVKKNKMPAGKTIQQRIRKFSPNLDNKEHSSYSKSGSIRLKHTNLK